MLVAEMLIQKNTTRKTTEMNRKQFLKRLGLLSSTAIAAPAILADNLQSLITTTKPTESVERMRIYASGNVGMGVLNPKQKFIIRNDT
jgi:hypothetical protein